jgi:hypothetical protein
MCVCAQWLMCRALVYKASSMTLLSLLFVVFVAIVLIAIAQREVNMLCAHAQGLVI